MATGLSTQLYFEQISLFAPRLLNFFRMNFDKIFLAFSLGSLPLAQYYFAQGIVDQARTQLFLAFERVVSSDYRRYKNFQFSEYFNRGTLLLFGISWGAMIALKLILFSLPWILPDWFNSAYLFEIFLLLFVAFGLFGFSSEVLQLDGKGFSLSLITFVNVIFVYTVILTFGHSFTIQHLAYLSVFSALLQRIFSFIFLIHFRGAADVFGQDIWRWVFVFAGRIVAFVVTAIAGSQVELVSVFIAWAIFVFTARQYSSRKMLK